MAAGAYGIRLIVVALCFSYLFSFSSSITITRSGNLGLKSQSIHGVSDKAYKENINVESWEWKTTKMRRLMGIIEVDDYPGSGANNRHTPRPQLGRGCLDC